MQVSVFRPLEGPIGGVRFVFLYYNPRTTCVVPDLPRLCDRTARSPISHSVSTQLLDSLPHTVRGVGREIVGHRQLPQPVNSHGHGGLRQRRERKRDRTIDLVGFIIVVCTRSPPSIVVIH